VLEDFVASDGLALNMAKKLSSTGSSASYRVFSALFPTSNATVTCKLVFFLRLRITPWMINFFYRGYR
jgi:hypothetical protein